MTATVQPRTKDHWSLRLHIRRPSAASRVAVIILALAQALLMTLTASSLATGGGLYGCSAACQNIQTPGSAAVPSTPAIAIFFGILMLAIPLVIGALNESWAAAIAFAVLPWFPAILIGANALLAPINTIATTPVAKGGTGLPASTFGPPFWLDTAHLPTLLFSLGLFALLGWLGWVVGQALRGEA
jgi:hypothetical protein